MSATKKKASPASKHAGKPRTTADRSRRQRVELDSLRFDPRLQMRAHGLDECHLDDLADALTAGAKLPPLKVVRVDDGHLYVWDGHHTGAVCLRLRRRTVDVEIYPGVHPFEFAVLLAATANPAHGLKRSSADKRKAIAAVLSIRPHWSNREVARYVGVDDKTVGSVRHPDREHSNADTAEIPQDGNQNDEPAGVEEAPVEPAAVGEPGVSDNPVSRPGPSVNGHARRSAAEVVEAEVAGAWDAAMGRAVTAAEELLRQLSDLATGERGEDVRSVLKAAGGEYELKPASDSATRNKYGRGLPGTARTVFHCPAVLKLRDVLSDLRTSKRNE